MARSNSALSLPFILVYGLCMYGYVLYGRSIHRPEDPTIPCITTRFCHETITYQLKDYNLQEEPIFKVFDKKAYYSHMLPDGPITFRNHPDKTVLGATLSQLASNLLRDIQAGKKKYNGFQLLKGRDYYFKDRSGLLIFKYDDYPFVLKLFIETPQGFVHPYKKGFEPTCLFIMGGSIRHMTGFTRIKNIEQIRQRIKNHPAWKTIDMPRKWYWEPPDNKWLEVVGTNIGTAPVQKVMLPSVYGVIADAIDAKRKFSLANLEDRRFGMNFAQFLNFRSDPHMKNYLVENDTGTVVLIDTEYFPILVGLKQRLTAKTYTGWYIKLGKKFLANRLFRHKKARKDLQLPQHNFYVF